MRLLISERSIETASVLRRQLSRIADDIEFAEDASSTEQRLRAEHWDCLVADFEMLEASGRDVLSSICKSDAPVVFLSAQGSIATSVRAIRLGAFDFLVKPINSEKLIASVTAATANRSTATPPTIINPAKAVKPEKEDVKFFGDSPVMREVFDLIKSAGACSAP